MEPLTSTWGPGVRSGLPAAADAQSAPFSDAAEGVLGPSSVHTLAAASTAALAKTLPDNRTTVILLLDARVAMADLVTRRAVARHPLRGAPRPDAAAWGPAR